MIRLILYHGSNVVVPNPEINRGRASLDFGLGFYTTSIKIQSELWAKYKSKNTSRVDSVASPVVNCYSFNSSDLNQLNVLEFDSVSESWLDFIVLCRYAKHSHTYDIVIGEVADDDVFDTVDLYHRKLISKSEAIAKLKFKRPNNQYVFCTNKALKFVTFQGVIR